VKPKNIFFDKKLISIVIVFIILFVLLSVVYFFFNKKNEINNIYKGSTFEITVPEGWSVATSSILYKDLTVIRENQFSSPLNEDIFLSKEPIIIVVSKSSGTTTLEQYFNKIKTNLVPVSQRPFVKKYQLIDSKEISVNSSKGYLLSVLVDLEFPPSFLEKNSLNFTKDLDKRTMSKTYRSLNLITIKDNKLYTITTMTSADIWSKYEEIFNYVLTNFNP